MEGWCPSCSFGSLSCQTSYRYLWSVNHQGGKRPLFSLCWQCNS
uniref:Uncharacterized protein n=1 Tax=Arundo donax TaxID=35708 RepID=A0A0A9FAT1_ARUDO